MRKRKIWGGEGFGERENGREIKGGLKEAGVQAYKVSSKTLTIMEYLNGKEKEMSSISMGVMREKMS